MKEGSFGKDFLNPGCYFCTSIVLEAAADPVMYISGQNQVL